MPDRQEFLQRLEDEAGPALAAEARDHLEESIQARLELGLSPEEAEREALAVFGSAHRVATEARRRESQDDPPDCLAHGELLRRRRRSREGKLA